MIFLSLLHCNAVATLGGCFMENMHSLENRLREHASNGRAKTILRIYKNQIMKLVNMGCSVQKIDLGGCYPGQFRCLISWERAIPGTEAYDFLVITSSKNPTYWLDTSEEPIAAGGWLDI